MQTINKPFSLEDLSPRRREVSAKWEMIPAIEKLTLELQTLDKAGIDGVARDSIVNQLNSHAAIIDDRFQNMNRDAHFRNQCLQAEIDRAPTIEELQKYLNSLPELIRAQEQKLLNMTAFEAFEDQGRAVEELRGLKTDLEGSISKRIAEHPSLRKFSEIF
jgi:hypothetical protein